MFDVEAVAPRKGDTVDRSAGKVCEIWKPILHASSTAQGGTSLGRFGCCDAWMARRLMDRKVVGVVLVEKVAVANSPTTAECECES